MLSHRLLHHCCTHLAAAERIVLAFYALNIALEPTGVLISCDTTYLTVEIKQLQQLPRSAQLQLGLNLLTAHQQNQQARLPINQDLHNDHLSSHQCLP